MKHETPGSQVQTEPHAGVAIFHNKIKYTEFKKNLNFSLQPGTKWFTAQYQSAARELGSTDLSNRNNKVDSLRAIIKVFEINRINRIDVG